jgi:hypothetical protein
MGINISEPAQHDAILRSSRGPKTKKHLRMASAFR